jgi:hypothetical protein
MAVSVSRRNISRTVTFDRDRLEAVDALARGLGVSISGAIARLIDLHAGAQLEAIAADEPATVFAVERWRARKLTRELVALIAGAVREGATKADAYRSVEVSPRRGATWETKGREDIERDASSLQAELVASLERARDPEQFSLPARSQVDVTHRFQLLIDWDRLTLEKKKLLGALLREASPLEDHAAVTRTARPSIEAVPEEIVELLDEDVEEADWSEPPALEASAEPAG